MTTVEAVRGTRPIRAANGAQYQVQAIKRENISPAIIRNVLNASLSMRNPLIAVHVSPDGDALGSSIGMAIFLKRNGSDPSIYWNPKNKIPEFFTRIIREEGIRVVNALNGQYDGLISLDTSGPVRLEPAVADLLKSGTDIRVIDIDHHLGQEFLAEKEYTLATEEMTSSTSELIAQIVRPQFTPNLALALLGGIISDTKNLKSSLKPHTMQIAEELQSQVTMNREDIYAAVLDFSEGDKKMVSDCLAAATTSTFELRGRSYSILWKVIRQAQLTTEDLNWREALKDIFLFERGANIGLLVYWDPRHNTHRASLFTSLNDIDFRPIVERMKQEWGEGAVGGGHPERVVSYFRLEKYADDAQAAAGIIDLILKYSLSKNGSRDV